MEEEVDFSDNCILRNLPDKDFDFGPQIKISKLIQPRREVVSGVRGIIRGIGSGRGEAVPVAVFDRVILFCLKSRIPRIFAIVMINSASNGFNLKREKYIVELKDIPCFRGENEGIDLSIALVGNPRNNFPLTREGIQASFLVLMLSLVSHFPNNPLLK